MRDPRKGCACADAPLDDFDHARVARAMQRRASMDPILVLYATREGETRRIAEHLGATLRTRGLSADVWDVGAWPAARPLARHAAAIVAASVRDGAHDPDMVAFVKARRGELEAMPAALLSVGLSDAADDDALRTPAQRMAASADVRRRVARFLEETGWRAERVRPVAGALVYTQYGRFMRLAIRMIAKRAGATADAAYEHEFADWVGLDRLVDDVAAEASRRSA